MKLLLKRLIGFLFLCSIGMNFVLTNKLNETRALAQDVTSRLYPPEGWPLEPLVGESLVDTDGDRSSQRHEFEGNITLLIVNTPGCSICRGNYPQWQELIDQVKTRYPGVTIVMANTGSNQRSLGDKATVTRFDLGMIADAQSLVANRLHNFSPLTLLVDKSSKIVFTIPGSLNGVSFSPLYQRIALLCAAEVRSGCLI